MGMNSAVNIDYPSRYVSPPRILLDGMKVLVAGDTQGTVESLRSHFLQKRCEVETAYTSEEIKRKLLGNSFDILICGFLMSDEYSLRIIEIVRRLSDVRLLFLSGKKDSGFIAKALNLGADDCLTSSAFFTASLFELDARVLRLCHRNTNLSFRETKIVLNQKEHTVEIDMSCRSVKKNGRHLSLTKMEYRILLHFAFNKGRLVLKTDLEKILAREKDTFRGHSVNTHIFNLRKKFKTALSIKTVSCHGFVLAV